MNLRNEFQKIKKNFRFSNVELRNLFFVIFLFAFIRSFDDWGGATFDLLEGLKNLFLSFLIVGVVVFVHHSFQKLYAIHKGFLVEHLFWVPGVIVAIVLVVLTNGKVTIYAATGTMIAGMTRSRVGHFRYHPGVKELGKAALWGLFGVTFVSGFFKTLDLWFGISLPFTEALFSFAMVFVVFNFLPIPPLDGSRIFFASRLVYVYLFGAILSYVFLISVGEVYSYFWSVLIGVLFVGLFYYFYERHW